MMYAKYAGNCHICDNDISVGEAVRWDTNTKVRIVHADCKPEDKELPTQEAQDELERTFLRGEFYPDPVSQ
jgi:hypothetical protein